VPDEKVFQGPAFIPGQHSLAAKDRRDIASKMGEDFSERDFEEMEGALDAAHAVYLYLQKAPSPRALKERLDKIRKAAEALRAVLFPVERDGSLAADAASRVIRRLEFPDWRGPQDLDTKLYRIVSAAEEEQAEVDEPWNIVSERGTEHLWYLVARLRGIAKRHGWPAKYVYDHVDEEHRSPTAELAMLLSEQWPIKERPRTIRGLIAVMQRHPPPDG
jgi:hypothetical protein